MNAFVLFSSKFLCHSLFNTFCSVSCHLWDMRFYCIYFNLQKWTHAAGRGKTNHSAAATDLITQTALSACENLMTVLQPDTSKTLLKPQKASLNQHGIGRDDSPHEDTEMSPTAIRLCVTHLCPGFCPSDSTLTALHLLTLVPFVPRDC